MNKKEIQKATCALFIELANADGLFSAEELDRIFLSMKNLFELNQEDINDLIVESTQNVKNSVSISEFSSIVRDSFSFEQKFELMLELWRLIYTDNRLDMYEDSLIKKIAGSINVSHTEMINAKMLIRQELKLN